MTTSTASYVTVLQLEGLVQSRTMSDGTRIGWVGDEQLLLSSEIEPGSFWRKLCALELKHGERYLCEVFETNVPTSTPWEKLPEGTEVPGLSAEFFARARPVTSLALPADRRVKLKHHLGIWTDGLMVSADPAKVPLVAGRVYRVVVKRQDSDAA